MAVEISGPPAVNFYSMLSGLGDTIAQNRKEATRREAFAAATTPGADGTVDFSKAILGLANSGDLQGAQLFASLQAHKDAIAHQATADARQAGRDTAEDKYRSASLDIQRRAADRADEDKFSLGKVENPDGTTSFVKFNPRTGDVASTGPRPTPQAGNPFAEGGGKFNADQAKAAGFTDRMLQSEGILRGTDGQAGVEGQGTSYVQNRLSQAPLGVGNYLISNDRQKYEQAKRDFINAQLRRESGAAISPSEFESADKQYFPIPGDSPDVIKQKAANRRSAVAAMGREGGPSYRPQAIFTDDGRIVPVPKQMPRPAGQGNGADALLQQARDAISQGAPRDAVIQRLQGAGIDPSAL